MGSLVNHIKVINATGVVLHTNLGRAPLPGSIVQAMAEASGYIILEVDRESGDRGERITLISQKLASSTGAEAGLAVNNNAAAIMLALAALVAPGKIAAAQSHLVEIGGSFRLPDVLTQSGCKLMAVGAANIARLEDYQESLENGANAIIVAHHSNFWFEGETYQPHLSQLVALAGQFNVPLIYDLGTGAMVDLNRWGIATEMTAIRAVQSGADIICFSGDKLFGGPQAGIVVGKSTAIKKMLAHPLYRAIRLDKTILAGLGRMLDIYQQGEGAALAEIPTLKMLTEPEATIKARAERVWRELPKSLAEQCRVAMTTSKPGGGTLPQAEMPSWALAIRPTGATLRELARRLRMGEPSVWGRLSGKDMWLDMRTVAEEEVGLLEQALEMAMA